MDVDGNTARRKVVPQVSGQVGKICISGRPKASPIVLLPACLPLEHPRVSLVQISLPYSLPPMEVLRIVSFCLLLNV